jgi:hypothetical protein
LTRILANTLPVANSFANLSLPSPEPFSTDVIGQSFKWNFLFPNSLRSHAILISPAPRIHRQVRACIFVKRVTVRVNASAGIPCKMVGRSRNNADIPLWNNFTSGRMPSFDPCASSEAFKYPAPITNVATDSGDHLLRIFFNFVCFSLRLIHTHRERERERERESLGTSNTNKRPP